MHIIVFLAFGLVVGALARLLVPGSAPGGWITSMVIGVLGAFLGGFLGRAVGVYPAYRSTGGFLASLIGAVILVVIYQGIVSRRSRARW